MRKCRAPCRSQTPARNSIDSSDQRQSNPRGRERQYPSDHFQAKKRLYFTFSSWPDPLCGSGISQKSSLSIFFPQQISSTLSSKLRQWRSCHFDKRILILSIEPRPRLVYKPAHEQRTDFICPPAHLFETTRSNRPEILSLPKKRMRVAGLSVGAQVRSYSTLDD